MITNKIIKIVPKPRLKKENRSQLKQGKSTASFIREYKEKEEFKKMLAILYRREM